MSDSIATGVVHHLALTVSDVPRSVEFYGSLLGFKVVAEFGPRKLMSNGSVVLAVGPAPDSSQALPNDRFSENRLGLDHLSFSVANRQELEKAVQLFDQKGVSHGAITDLGPLGITILSFRDPDNIQVELTAPV